MPEINDLNYERVLDDALAPVLLIFTASFCGPSAWMELMVEDIVENIGPKLVVHTIDVEECPNITRNFQVKQTPTYIVTNGRKPLASRMGTSSYEGFKAWLDKVLEKAVDE